MYHTMRNISGHFARLVPTASKPPTLFSSSNTHRYVALLSTPANSITHMMIDVIGDDRPGIVADMTKCVTSLGGSVGQCQMSTIGKHFSVIMLVKIPSNQSNALDNCLNCMSGTKSRIFESDPPPVEITPQIGYMGLFHLYGADQPGILYQVTTILASHGVSINKLDTDEEVAPHGGTTLFVINGIITKTAPLGKTFDPKIIREELELLGDSLNCDITLKDMGTDSMEELGNIQYTQRFD